MYLAVTLFVSGLVQFPDTELQSLAEVQALEGGLAHRCCAGAFLESRVSQCVGIWVSRQQHQGVGCCNPSLSDDPPMAF